MRILFFIESLEAGGKERRLSELLGYLARQPGYRMKVVLTRNSVHYESITRLGIPLEVTERPPGRKTPGVFKQFYDICRDFDPDCVHVWGNMVAFYALPAVLLQRRKLINSQITNAVPRPRWWTFTGLTMTLNFALSDRVTANSAAGLRSHGVARWTESSGKYRVIPNGIDPGRFAVLHTDHVDEHQDAEIRQMTSAGDERRGSPAGKSRKETMTGSGVPDQEKLRKRFGLQTPFAVAMVGSFTGNKDYERYVAVCRILLDQRSDITFFAVGDGPEQERIRRMIPDQVRERIIFTGAIPDVEALLSICDIGVLLTDPEHHSEGISNALLEYMASGIPVIADNSGGTAELVRDGIDGILLPPDRSPEQIANVTGELINDRDRWREMGVSARERIMSTFTAERMGAAFEALYREVVPQSVSRVTAPVD